jgi:outer membrane protein insertion porin family
LRVLYYILITIVSIFFLLGCSSTKHLKKNEYIMYKNKIKGAPAEEYSNMTNLYKQRSNRKVIGLLPYVNLYNFGKLFYDTSKFVRKKQKIILKFDSKIASAQKQSKKSKLINRKEKKIKRKDLALSEGNTFMRSFGEPPEIFDSSKVKNTITSMKVYLFSKGYFHNKVHAKIDTAGRKRITVHYSIDKGRPFMIDTVTYQIADPRIDSLLNVPALFTKIIKTGEKYDESKLNTERENMYKLLKDNGYFYFQKNDILYDIDTLEEEYKLTITVIVEKKHEIYRVSRLFFNMNDLPDKYNSKIDTFLYRKVYYTFYKKTYLRKLLDYKISIRPFDIFSQSKFQLSQRLLGSMDIYKFVNINIEENKNDTTNHTLSAYINTQPMDKFQISQEYGLSVGQALIPGPFLSFTLKSRNLLKWLEVIENTLRYSFEAQYTTATSTEPYKARVFSAYTSINLSQLLFPTILRDLFKKYYPKVKFYTGYDFIKRPEYRRESFKAGLTYTYTRNAYSSFFLTPIEVTYVDSKLDYAYNKFLDSLYTFGGSNLFRSFKPSIVTDFQFSYIYNNHDFNATKVTKYVRPSFEIGGLVPSLIANKFGTSANKENSTLLGKQIYEYFRLGLDVRYYIPVKKKSSLVVRFNLGYAQPFGITGKSTSYILPYEKYFFSGGNSSIRAWKPRRLGPGSYTGNSSNGYLYEQPGEILFETNYEYRFKIVSIVNWAFFVDAGNVWTIKQEKEGSEFKLPDAIKQIAVGAGMGIRLDFSFLLLRLDVANKVVDPAQPIGERFVGKLSFKESTYNIGIGYPF